MLTQRSRYALRAMLILARAPAGLPVATVRLAGAAAVPRKFLEIILAEMRAAGLVALDGVCNALDDPAPSSATL